MSARPSSSLSSKPISSREASTSSSHIPVSGFRNNFPTATVAVEEPVIDPSSFKVRSSRRTSPMSLRSTKIFPLPSVKILPISPRGPRISPAAFTTASFISSPPTKVPASSKRGILMGFPFTSKLTGILRSKNVPLAGSKVIDIGKGRLSGPI